MKTIDFIFVLVSVSLITLFGGVPSEDSYSHEYNPTIELEQR